MFPWFTGAEPSTASLAAKSAKVAGLDTLHSGQYGATNIVAIKAAKCGTNLVPDSNTLAGKCVGADNHNGVIA